MDNILYLKVDSTESFAWVRAIPNRKHVMFKVTFENGYENIFFTDVETGDWIEEDMGFTKLASEIGLQTKCFARHAVHVPKILTWHKENSNKNLCCFGFFDFRKDDHNMYEIYGSNKKYLYTLVELKDEEWQILGNNTTIMRNIDPVFLDNVIRILPLYRLKLK